MSYPSRRPLALTVGDPAGIGPDIVVQALAYDGLGAAAIVIGDRATLEDRAQQLRLKFDVPAYDPEQPQPASLLQIDAARKPQAGKPDTANADHVLAQLDRAHELAASKEASGIVTGPISKANVNAARPGFAGHTGYFAERCGAKRAVMAFIGPSLRGALVTGHIPLAQVPAAITADAVYETLRAADEGMCKVGQGPPVKWLVCGLNPHAGEDGLLGTEDRDEITPAIERAQQSGLNVRGPVPADTAFLDDRFCVLGMYHDQLLPAIKTDCFSQTVNLTFGLSYPRTSVGHGTAYDLAGTGKAEYLSLLAAVQAAASWFPLA